MARKKVVGIIGGGSFATAIAKLLSNNVTRFHWYMHDDKQVKHIQQYGHNKKYLSEIQFDNQKLNITSDINEVVDACNVLFLVVPSIYVKETLDKVKGSLRRKTIVSCIKGIEPTTNLPITQYMRQYFRVSEDRIGTISGPCHAEELAMKKQSYLTISFKKEKRAEAIKSYLKARYLRFSLSNDVVGTELGAVLKNVFSLVIGIAHGLGYGDNYKAVLIANCMKEMAVLIQKVAPQERQINDSAYLGDLLVTAYSQFGRNRMFGIMVGKGYSPQMVMMEMTMVAEGYHGVRGVKKFKEDLNIETPILDAAYNILHENVAPDIEFDHISKWIR